MTVQYQVLNADLKRRYVEATQNPKADSKAEINKIAAELLETNKSLLWAEVCKFTKSAKASREDLYSAAAENLWKLFLKWDPDRSALSVAARMPLSGAVRREVAATEFPEMSYDQFTKRGNLLKAAKKLESSLGRKPTFEELSHETGVREDVVQFVLHPDEIQLQAPVAGKDGSTTTVMDLLDAPAEEDSSEWVLEKVDTAQFWYTNATENDLYRWYMAGNSPTTPTIPHKAVQLCTGVAKHDVQRGAMFAEAETAVARIFEVLGRDPNAQELSAATDMQLEDAAQFLSKSR